ncbi:hypothetical protein Taro_019511, partial [Colocasia esculenta]|nr:hypothetical protein [Colocasia esculenta]
VCKKRVFLDLLRKKEKCLCAPFMVIYVHTPSYMSWMENFLRVFALRSVFVILASTIYDNHEAIYFVHSNLQWHLFSVTFGHFSSKNSLHQISTSKKPTFLLPKFVYDHDKELEHYPLMDYGLKSDYHHKRATTPPHHY